jgi:hypothetical protein
MTDLLCVGEPMLEFNRQPDAPMPCRKDVEAFLAGAPL